MAGTLDRAGSLDLHTAFSTTQSVLIISLYNSVTLPFLSHYQLKPDCQTRNNLFLICKCKMRKEGQEKKGRPRKGKKEGQKEEVRRKAE